ncbi:S41 family peptidase [Candidatus Dojkabacteria bacterium]|uniref:S41 family peptidase n=1 Tax=Candidatus Dojkabacteria bacterium TaxID=2099670 RepID=A0A955L9B0_9BACT|nr:S41 family peptidase [Candidatus Dojkabacteria bacterium]
MDFNQKHSVEEVKKGNSYSNILLVAIIICIIFSGGFIFGSISAKIQVKKQFDTTIQGPNLSEVGIFPIYQQVWNTIQNEYLFQELDYNDLVYGSIQGLVSSLGDNYSAFLTPTQNEAHQNSNASKYQGIGVILRYDEVSGYTFVETPLPGYPATNAGIRAGDFIVEVDGKDMQDLRSAEVAQHILGEANTDVTIKFFRKDENDFFDRTITRAFIDLDNIEYAFLDNGIVHIEIHQFTESSVAEFKQSWNEIVDEIVTNSPRGIILDLRNNPGGYVSAATYVIEEFLSQGTIVLREETRDGEALEVTTLRNGRLGGTPLIVLVNGGSASASEIVAGALQDHQRADLVGTQTVGKGVEQKIIELPDGSALHLVFKRWLTPNGHFVTNEDPLQPDFQVEVTEEDIINEQDPQLEKALELLSSM